MDGVVKPLTGCEHVAMAENDTVVYTAGARTDPVNAGTAIYKSVGGAAFRVVFKGGQAAPKNLSPSAVGLDIGYWDTGRAAATAMSTRPELARKIISPHIFRHSLAMKLLQSGVDLLTIQAWLGHSQVATTHRCAAADVQMMRRGLHKAGVSGQHAARFKPRDAIIQLLESI